jgi:type II secretory pathway predicted ATPase ExeA
VSKKLHALYGLKWNPFTTELPTEALFCTKKVESFCWRIEQGHVREGGFALVTGEPGSGKSVALRILASRLARLGEATVGALQHPQSNISDFYREMGELFGVEFKPHNRWCSFKSLRERWLLHIETTAMRPVLLVDEAQEMRSRVLSELRILSSADFDSRSILTVVLCGDGRLTETLRDEELMPLGSRMRARLVMEPASPDELLACLRHLLKTAGNASLMTPELMAALCDHAAGSYRILANMAADLLAAAVQREATSLDEKLFFDVFAIEGRGQAASKGAPRRDAQRSK